MTAPRVDDFAAARIEAHSAGALPKRRRAARRQHRHDLAPRRAQSRSPPTTRSLRNDPLSRSCEHLRQRAPERVPRAPQSARHKPRQDRPDSLAARTSVSPHFDQEHLESSVASQIPNSSPMTVRPWVPTAAAMSRSVVFDVRERQLVSRKICDLIRDQSSALLTGRVRKIQACFGTRRLGPGWSWSVVCFH